MKVLALECYYGGSHRTFLDGWIQSSMHDWTLLTLPPSKWKWRMRHGAVTFADEVHHLSAKGQNWDLLFCSDMLNLAEFLGLARDTLGRIPVAVYFHENQLTYPVRFESERDYQYAFTNMTTALAARQVWFNSAFHLNEFLDALKDFLERMPDNRLTDTVEKIRLKSVVYPPGIDIPVRRGKRKPGPIRILWAARWEHDKNPDDFFEAMKCLKEKGIDFILNVIGEQFQELPGVFERAKVYFAGNINRWGYQASMEAYRAALNESDIVVSTAKHEFFGISMVEAVASGVYPVLPKRLAYPEIMGLEDTASKDKFFYDGTVSGLVKKLVALSERAQCSQLWTDDCENLSRTMERFYWPILTPVLDGALEKIAAGKLNEA